MAAITDIDSTVLQRVPELEGVARKLPVQNQGINEKVKVFQRSFSIPWEEVQTMTKAEIMDTYVRMAVGQMVNLIKAKAAQLGRTVSFRRFAVPDNSLNRRYFVYDNGGVFFAVMAHRTAHAIGKTKTPGIDRLAQVVEFSIRAVVALEEGEEI